MNGSRSTRWTSYPLSAMSFAARIPATPAPITRAVFVTATSLLSSGSSSAARATDSSTSLFAFSVPASLSLWIQEQCSRMFAISKRKGFRPASATVARKVGSCIRGEHEATTTRFRS